MMDKIQLLNDLLEKEALRREALGKPALFYREREVVYLNSWMSGQQVPILGCIKSYQEAIEASYEEMNELVDFTKDSISIKDLPQISNPTICGRILPFHVHIVGCSTRFEQPCLVQVYITPIVPEIKKVLVNTDDNYDDYDH
jgi:hypothetical protein